MPDQTIVTELKVSGHLMKLEPGIYCVFHNAGEQGPDPATGLPGIRISLSPAATGDARAVEISGFRADGWISSGQDAALIRVNEGPAEVLVTVYQSANRGEVRPPRLQIVRLGDSAAGAPNSGAAPPPRPLSTESPAASPPPARGAGTVIPGVLAHVQGSGDVRAPLGEWVGSRGSRRWIEGFAIRPPPGIEAGDLEYRAVLGHGWVTPWSQAGEFCGSRHMALPVLGIIVRLGEAAASGFECGYLACFTDGTVAGPVAPGERCVAESLAPLEALQIILRRRRAVMPVAIDAAPPAPAKVHRTPSAKGRIAPSPVPARRRH